MNACPEIRVRPIRADEGAQLRTLRLCALADAPNAFAETLADAERMPSEYWAGRTAELAACTTRVTVAAIEQASGAWRGMAGGYLEPGEPDLAYLVAMWVDPAWRRRGIARGLIEAVAAWARGRGARRLAMWVTETNTPALRLYTRAGFAPTGASQPLPSNPTLREWLLAGDL